MITSIRFFAGIMLLVAGLAARALAEPAPVPLSAYTLSAVYGGGEPLAPLPAAPAYVPPSLVTPGPIAPPPHRGLYICLQVGGGYTVVAARTRSTSTAVRAPDARIYGT